MANRVQRAQQAKDNTKDTNTQPFPTQTTGKLALAHIDELSAIWPANPRIPSVESRRAWALARNVTPSNVHNWFSRRRTIAKKLKLRIPQETYELPVGNPPVVPVIVKDEPVVPELELVWMNQPAPELEPSSTSDPAPSTNKKVKVETVATPIPPQNPSKQDVAGDYVVAVAERTKGLKRKRDAAPQDIVPEPTTQPKSKKKKVGPAASSDMLTKEAKSKPSLKEIKTEVDVAGEDAILSAPTKKSKKKTKKADTKLPSDNATQQPEQPLLPKKTLKRKRNVQLEPTSGDVPEPTTPPKKKKKAKKVALDSSPIGEAREPKAPAVPPSKKRKMVKFESSAADDMPPSSSPTLYASSPPPSDAPTIADNTPPSSPLSKFAKNRAYIHETSPAKGLVEDQGGSAKQHTRNLAATVKENRAPLKSALKKTKAPKKRKVTAVAASVPEPEEELFCDQGNRDASTGFTCVLCTPSPDDPVVADSATDEPREVFDWCFGFPAYTLPLGDYTGVTIDATSLSALPFLAAPAQFLAPEPSQDQLKGLAYDTDCTETDGLHFTYDGMATGEPEAGGFFPVLPTGGDEWKGLAVGGLLLNDAGQWVQSDGSLWEGEGGGRLMDDEDVDEGILRLPAFDFSDSEEEEEEEEEPED
ncbi:hypothetical protein DFH06DRAFT_589917 [Mycena polygramma]|nr:hypothetical protein DFH06DRAFT_589917 [Mycena polygramma]